MEHNLLITLIVLAFTLMAVSAFLYVPFKIAMFCIRGIAHATQKTVAVIIPSKN